MPCWTSISWNCPKAPFPKRYGLRYRQWLHVDYGSKSERGTRVAALFYTLIESAKLARIEPAGYLAEATRRAIDNAGTVTLPRDLASA